MLSLQTKPWLLVRFVKGIAGWQVAMLAASLVLFAVTAAGPVGAQPQPVQFNHEVHVQRMTCIFCHRLYETQEMAGRPELSRCMLCHAYPVSSSPEADKLQAFADGTREIPWVRHTFLKPDVRFSHQRHVGVGQVACAACHGDIAHTTAPPDAALIPITMQLCLDCHSAARVTLAPNAAAALAEAGIADNVVRALQHWERRRFTSGEALIAELEQRVGPLPPGAVGPINGQLRPAPPVTEDCFACHR